MEIALSRVRMLEMVLQKIEYGSSSEREDVDKPLRKSPRYVDVPLKPPRDCPDVEMAQIKYACAIYASALLCGKTFEDMSNWYIVKRYWNGKSGVDTEKILECLKSHKKKAIYLASLNGVAMRNLPGSFKFKRNTYYLMVYATHVNVYYNGMINERMLALLFESQWIEPAKIFENKHLDSDLCKNKFIDSAYEIQDA